jgi:PAS domain S-box-containing protein
MTAHLEGLVARRTAALRATNEVLEAEIKERARAEADLRRNRDYLRQLTDSLADIVFSVKVPERVIEWVNDAVRQLGYAPEECIGRSTRFLYADREEYIAMGEALRVADSEGRQVLRKSIVFLKKDGALCPVDVTVSFFRVDGRLASATGIARDVTERLEKEKRIQKYQDRLKALAADLTITEERERRRIAEELHDGPVQALAFARMRLAPARDAVGNGEGARALDEVSKCIRQAAMDASRVVSDLSSRSLGTLGLAAALTEWAAEQIAGRFGIATQVVNHLDPAAVQDLGDLTCTILFRNARELLSNAVKHSGAKHVRVVIQRTGDDLRLVVQDDGCGCDPASALEKVGPEGGFGLFSIRERMADLGGELAIDSEPGHGFTASLVVPSAFGANPEGP